jgi:hypothetical protein
VSPGSSGVLLFSAVGYGTKEVAVNGNSVINISLIQTSASLNDVVVIGYTQQSTKKNTAAISKLDIAAFCFGFGFGMFDANNMPQQWYEQMKSDMKSALELERRIQHFMDKYIVPFITEHKYSNQAVDKFLAAVGGWSSISQRLRWPYNSINENEINSVRSAGQKLLPEFFN